MASTHATYGDQQMDVVPAEKNILHLLDFNTEVSISLIIHAKIIKFKLISNFHFSTHSKQRQYERSKK